MFQGIQLALDGVHLSVDVLLGDVLVSLDLHDGARSPEGQPTPPPPGLRPEASLLSPASTGPAPRLCATPRGGEEWVPQPLHIPSPRADRHARRRQLPASCGNFLPLLCHSRKDVIGVRAPLEEKLKTLLGCLSGTGHVTVCSLNCYFVKVTSDTHHPLLLVENS